MSDTITASISDKHKLLGLDHLRALAITYVLLFHYQLFGHPEWVNSIGVFGWTGVDLFFVLSGFLIAGQLFNTIKKGKTIDMREFFAKRFLSGSFRLTWLYCFYILPSHSCASGNIWPRSGNTSPLPSIWAGSENHRHLYPCLVVMCGGTVLFNIALNLLAAQPF